MVPKVGIAPTSPRLQGGANLSQLLGERESSKLQHPNSREAPMFKLQESDERGPCFDCLAQPIKAGIRPKNKEL